jgi:hypothetical protein
MKKLKNFAFGASLLTILAGGPGCATVGDAITKDPQIAGSYVVDNHLQGDINTLLNMYTWGNYKEIPVLAQQIYDQIPDEVEDNFFLVDAIVANAMRKAAVKAGEEHMYWESEAKFKETFVKMDNAFNSSGLEMEDWLNSSEYMDNNRLGKWVLLDSWGLFNKDYVEAGINFDRDSQETLYYSWAHFDMAKQLTEGLDGKWERIRGVSERHIREVKEVLEDYID